MDEKEIDQKVEEKPKKKKAEKVIIKKVERPKPLYRVESWKGVVNVYICQQCGEQNNDLDALKIHIVSHYPESQKESILERLIKE